jgi:hypothetical protein
VTREQRQALRDIALTALSATRPDREERQAAPRDAWKLQTSNSHRRIGAHGDGDVLCGTTHPRDHHPDLLARPGVLEYIVATQPRVVLELLDALDALDPGGDL